MSTIPSTQFVDACTNGYVSEKPQLKIQRYFTDGITHPFDQVEWGIRDAIISGKDGEIIFEQKGVEFPESWSQQAVNIFSQKYFRGPLGSPQRETSLKQCIGRVVHKIGGWGFMDGYFDTESMSIFKQELVCILLNQMASFNSPVWFNIGVPGTPQVGSACFILDVEDNLGSIFNWYVEEGNIFANGSGSGTNLSKLRGKNEHLSGGGKASGPMSFDRVADANGGVIKSGGKTRRSARMIILDADHPDIEDFISCKVKEEKKAQVLKAAGYDDSLDGEIYQTLAYQNGNYSVGVTDDFMKCVEENMMWVLRNRVDSSESKRVAAKYLFRKIAEAAHNCADPGIQFQDTMNKWHTCPNDGAITTTNPCSEYIFLCDTACNLSSINLIKFLMKDGKTFNTGSFTHTVNILVTAMDILVGRADYPTEKIKEQSHKFRTVGLGYTNLGGLLMVKSLPYDSADGRDYAASITSLMTGAAYKHSAILAEHVGQFPGYGLNRYPMMSIIAKHIEAIPQDNHGPLSDADIWMAASSLWAEAESLGSRHGYRNAQVTLLAPTGTISFGMDASTTGIEPEMSLVKYKKLSGGGTLKMVNPLVEQSLKNLGYKNITNRLSNVEGCGDPLVRPEHKAIFDCAFPTTEGSRSISWEGHVKMVAAVQPFLSGGVSKSVNMPNSSTIEDVERAYVMAWKLGLKSISVYRDGCKFQQPVTTKQEGVSALTTLQEAPSGEPDNRQPSEHAIFTSVGARRRLPVDRPAQTHKFSIGGQQEGYITVGFYEDMTLGEVFLRISKEGSTIAGLMDTIATLTSMALQYGVPLSALVEKFSHTRFEPSGFTGNKEIPIAKSLVDYIFRWLGLKFLPSDQKIQSQTIASEPTVLDGSAGLQNIDYTNVVPSIYSDAPLCSECGSLCQRSGSCYTCTCCGSSSGCA